MKIQERSYSTKFLRPRPLIHVDEEGSLIVIANSWGYPEHAKKCLEEVVRYITTAMSDVEVTSAFEYLTSLTDEVNHLRTALKLVNETLYRVDNRSQYVCGVEIVALYRKGTQLAWAQVGSPSIFLQKNYQNLQPLSVCHDLSAELFSGDPLAERAMPPLPGQLLGLERTCNVQCGHTYVRDGDQVVLISSSMVSNHLLTRKGRDQNLAGITELMIQESPEIPFWLGIVDL